MRRCNAFVHMRMAVLFHLITITVVMMPLCLTSFAADPVKPTWTTSGCSSGFTHCANVTTKEVWSEDGNFIYFFLDAMMSNNGGTEGNTTVWYIGENFDNSWAEDLQRDSFNVVRFSPRGSENAYPQITCDKAHYNNADCQLDSFCVKQIANLKLNMSHYSIAETAKDLEWVVKTLGAGKRNVLVAEGLGTFVVERLLRQVGGLDNVYVIMAGYTHPEYFDIFESIGNYDDSLRLLLEYCEMDPSFICLSRVGAFEGMWNRFVNVMKAAEAGTLDCNNQLKWGVKPEKIHLEYRAIMAALLKFPSNFLLQSQTEMAQLIPSFIYRLQRCDVRDQEALTNLYQYIKNGAKVQCPSFIPQRYNWLMSELTLSPPPPTAEGLFSFKAATQFVLPNISVLQQLYEIYNYYPNYTVSDRSIAKSSVSTLLLPSSMDPVFPFSMAMLATKVYDGALRFLSHQTSFPVANMAMNCIKSNLLTVRALGKWADDDECNISSRFELDFIGMNARAYYGVPDMWDFTVPNAPEPLPSAPVTPQQPTAADDCCGHYKRTTVVLAIFFTLTLVAFLVLGYYYWNKGQVTFSGDFYSNLR